MWKLRRSSTTHVVPLAIILVLLYLNFGLFLNEGDMPVPLDGIKPVALDSFEQRPAQQATSKGMANERQRQQQSDHVDTSKSVFKKSSTSMQMRDEEKLEAVKMVLNK